MNMHFIRGKQIDRSGSSPNVKRKVPPVQGTEYPKMNICEDNNIHFQIGRTLLVTKWLKKVIAFSLTMLTK